MSTHPSDLTATVRALEARVTDLEVRSAYQDQTIEALDAVVREFARRVEALEKELEELRRGAAPAPIDPPREDDYSLL